MFILDVRDSRPIYEQLMSHIIQMIINGYLKSDEKIPSVRELASTLAINPNTIQKAYRELERKGYIYSVTGKGTYVQSSDWNLTNTLKNNILGELERLIGEIKYYKIKESEVIDIVRGVYGIQGGASC